MSMITGCPACGTMFRVVPDQLKISEGWVRCGQCGEVFDATASMRPDAAAGAAAPEPQEGPARTAPDADSGVTPLRLLRQDAAEQDPEPSPVEPPRPVEEPPPLPVALAPKPVQDFAPSEDADDDFVDARFHPQDARVSTFEDSLPAGRSSSFQPGTPSAGLSGFSHSTSARPWPSEPPDDEVEDLSFVRQARRKAFWSRPSTRLGLLLGALGLAALLGLQYTVQERHRLAAVNPNLKPWLEALCVPLACAIGPPQRIEAILIDNSGFTRLRPDAYRLSFSLRNQSDQPVAVPSLQLTLTDTQDQAVLQRVLTPQELGAPSPTIAPASEFAASVALAVDAAAGAGRIAGYRLLAFYP